MGKSPCCEKMELKKGPWTPEEDKKLLAYIEKHGHGSWRALPMKAGLQRCGKSCRLRWINYLRPDIKRGKFSLQEDQNIIQLHALLGNRWSAIAAHLPKRTDNEIKNHWNTHLKKRLTKMGIDPMTHKPKINSHGSTSNLSHMAQWESARLEAEARLVRESNQVSNDSNHPNQHQLGSTLVRFTNKAPTQTTRPQSLDVLKAWQVVVSGMFTVGCDNFESLASRLNLSDDVLPISLIEFNRNPASELDFATSSVACTGGGGEYTWECLDISNEVMHADNSACFADSFVIGNIVNDFPCMLDYNFDDQNLMMAGECCHYQ